MHEVLVPAGRDEPVGASRHKGVLQPLRRRQAGVGTAQHPGDGHAAQRTLGPSSLLAGGRRAAALDRGSLLRVLEVLRQHCCIGRGPEPHEEDASGLAGLAEVAALVTDRVAVDERGTGRSR